MHISKIELENIKSHTSSTFEFTRGTTAITGENGAGKTTIIEAIAWVLFDLLEYKKEDFVRRGAKKGSVTVTFESGLDEREYIVYRDSGAGYHVTDPRLQTRIGDKKEEVFRFLWQHLGLEPGTDLKSLFRQAIGVPQGTFTAIFLEGATERKVAFDRLLKVEEYRQAAEKLRETSRFLDTSIGGVREDIARGEGELLRSGMVEQEYKATAEQTKQLAEQIQAISEDLAARLALVKEFDAKEQKVNALQTALDRLKSEKEKALLVLGQSEQSVEQASAAVAKIDSVRAEYQRHIEILLRLKDLERERNDRDKFRAELAKIESAIVNVKADQKSLIENIEAAQRAHREIERLRPKAVEQERLETELAGLRETAAFVMTTDTRIKGIDEQLERLRESFRVNQARQKEAQVNSQAAAGLGTLERRHAELLRKLANLSASLERDEKFQSEIRNGLCPILSQKCLNLSEGETLESFVTSQFIDLRSRIAVAESEHATVTFNLKVARDAERFSASLAGYVDRRQELTDEGERLKEEKVALEIRVEGFTDAEAKLTAAETAIKTLDDPRSRIRFLENETAREIELREGMTKIESNLERLENDRRISVEQLETYKDFDVQWTNLSAEREATTEAYRVFLANDSEAKTLADRQAQLEVAKVKLVDLTAKTDAAELELANAGAGYDRERHNAEKTSLREIDNSYHVTRSTLEAAGQREAQLAAELKRFAEIRKSLQSEFKEKERLEKVAEATAFIRDTLKEAAPRIARNYVHHVSLEANQMFREITGNAELTLKWAEDYSIILEEDGYERPFISLSGGEQMSAALSVRLALLKQLSDIRIAFFDEPTTNLDAERRENFAQQISRITHFDQLFVISHDDTFDSYVDNVVTIEDG